jgi:phage tail sheath protein FI
MTRINQTEREKLYDVKINPIVRFPREGYVIMSQNTLEQAGTALGAVNVQRMLFDLKKQIIDIGNRLVWEQITPSLKADIKKQFTPVLATMQARQGINGFVVVCDNTNNTTADADANKINVRIAVIPTKAVEFIAIDFIITKSGVEFA